MADKIGQILIKKNIISAWDLIEAMKRKKQEPKKYFGQILCEMGLPQSKIIKCIYYSNKRKQLGQILVEQNIITAEQLQINLSKQKDLKVKREYMLLGTLMLKLGIINEDNYRDALSAHFSLPIVSLKSYKIDPSMQKAIGEEFAMNNRIIVLNNSPLELTVAIAEPNPLLFEGLEKAMPEGKHVMFYITKYSEIESCFDEKYNLYGYDGYRGTR
jgi:Type II secretion system (T2SS), protein E, N-terminal domain